MIFLLDTTTVSDLIREQPAIVARLERLPGADDVVTCTTVRGEILHGIFRLPDGRKRRELERKATEILAGFPCEALAPAVADMYADLRVSQEKLELRLDENDLWIAATARHLGATVVTRDADFRHVSGLAVEDWSSPP